MINSELQKKVTLEKIEMLKESLTAPVNPNISLKLAQAAKAGVESLIKDLEKEVKDYEETKSK